MGRAARSTLSASVLGALGRLIAVEHHLEHVVSEDEVAALAAFP